LFVDDKEVKPMRPKLFTLERIRKLKMREAEMKAGKAVPLKNAANLDKEMLKILAKMRKLKGAA
jgi:hypothetical protein